MALEATNALVAFSIMALADAVLVFATEAAVSTTADMTRASLGMTVHCSEVRWDTCQERKRVKATKEIRIR